MSEVVLSGAAGVAVGACVAIGVLLAGGAVLAYKGLAWLSAAAEREMERLEAELAAPLTHATTGEAREEFEKKVSLLRSKASKNPALRRHAEAVAAILAVRTSVLGAFVTPEEAQRLVRPGTGRRYLNEVLRKAETRFTDASVAHITESVTEVGQEEGFLDTTKSTKEREQTIVMKNSEGRALVVQVKRAHDGPQLKLDLAGFGDGSCHAVMDRVLEGLLRRGVRLSDSRRQSHYRREGVLLGDGATAHNPDTPGQRRPGRSEGEEDRRRRRVHHQEPARQRGLA